MIEKRILLLSGNLTGKISGGMGVATAEIAKSLAAITPLQLVKSGEEQFPSIRLVHTISLTAKKPEQTILFSQFNTQLTESIEYDFLISPYRTDLIPFTKTETKVEESTGSITIKPKTLSYIEEVALYNTKIIELAETLSFDIIYCHDWITFQAGIGLKLKTGKKLILHIHSLETDRQPHDKNLSIYYLERKAMDYADAIIAVSEYTKTQIKKHYEIYEGKINVVYNGFKPFPMHNIEQHSNNQQLLFMGRLTSQKGILNFIKIAELVYEKVPTVQFIMAGEGDLIEEVEYQISISPAADNLYLLGYLDQEEKENLLREIDIFCMPSISEPFGLSAIEAASAGIPCIISNQSGIAEILKSSLKADNQDIETFADHILTLLKNEALRKTISNEQKAEISSLTWENTASQIKDIIQKIA